jgi:hypothetical protein
MALTLFPAAAVIDHQTWPVKLTKRCCCKCEENGTITAVSTGKLIQEAELIFSTAREVQP